MISATVVLDSRNPLLGTRLTTFELTYPRWIHSEFMTYRRYSRNSASSRAIPTPTLLTMLRENPALPVYWGKNQSGMAAAEELEENAIAKARELWLTALEDVIRTVQKLQRLKLHKQIANRLLEPWMHMSTVVTANEMAYRWMFYQRISPAAQPEFALLAMAMRTALNASVPTARETHFPYLTGSEESALGGVDAPKISAARVGRVSFWRAGQAKSRAEDLERHDGFVSGGHWSPLEHQAWAMPQPGSSRNFADWTQYRALLDQDSVEKFG